VIIVALVVAWLLVLVPIIARRRQEVARTADSALAARIVHSGGARIRVEEEFTMADSGEADTVRDEKGMPFQAGAGEYVDDYDDEFVDEDEFSDDEFQDGDFSDEELSDEEFSDEELSDDGAEIGADAEAGEDLVAEDDLMDTDDPDGMDDHLPARPYRPGRGGFDPEAAAISARARYAVRQRAVVVMLVLAVVTALGGGLVLPMLWWAHVVVDLALVSYLTYLRRQVRIEEEVRQRRQARLAADWQAGTMGSAEDGYLADDAESGDFDGDAAATAARHSVPSGASAFVRARPVPGTVVVDLDDEDPLFDELDEPGALPYRRAVGE
jgi:hypothetical protein